MLIILGLIVGQVRKNDYLCTRICETYSMNIHYIRIPFRIACGSELASQLHNLLQESVSGEQRAASNGITTVVQRESFCVENNFYTTLINSFSFNHH